MEGVISRPVRFRKQEGPCINEYIKAEEVRVVDESGEMIGVLPINEAISRAEDVGLDLVEVSPNVDIPVCKIIDYGKYKYEQQKKKSEAKKKQKIILTKEIKLTLRIEENDYNVKLKRAMDFLTAGNKIKVSLRFRGREIEQTYKAIELMNKFFANISGIEVKQETSPRREGRQVIMIVAPSSE